MAIPKKYKKQIKSAYNSAKRSNEPSSSRSPKRVWTFKAGDLVKNTATDDWGVVLSSPTSSGLMSILTSAGKKNWYASRLERVQKLQF